METVIRQSGDYALVFTEEGYCWRWITPAGYRWYWRPATRQWSGRSEPVATEEAATEGLGPVALVL